MTPYFQTVMNKGSLIKIPESTTRHLISLKENKSLQVLQAERDLKVCDLVSRKEIPSLESLKKYIGVEELTIVVSKGLEAFLRSIGRDNDMNASQCLTFSYDYIEDNPDFKLEDLICFFRFIKSSKEKIYKLDYISLMRFLQSYKEERIDEVERYHRQLKEQTVFGSQQRQGLTSLDNVKKQLTK